MQNPFDGNTNYTGSTHIPFIFFKEEGSDLEKKPQEDLESEDIQGSRRRLLCHACRVFVTSEESKTSVDGKNEHVEANPAGVVFHIGCFLGAPGCMQAGTPSTEWSWFKGYSWQLSLCKSCGLHLGWRFNSGARHFYGLILSRLVLEESSENPK